MSNLKFDENYINEVVKFNSECAGELEDIFMEYQKILLFSLSMMTSSSSTKGFKASIASAK